MRIARGINELFETPQSVLRQEQTVLFCTDPIAATAVTIDGSDRTIRDQTTLLDGGVRMLAQQVQSVVPRANEQMLLLGIDEEHRNLGRRIAKRVEGFDALLFHTLDPVLPGKIQLFGVTDLVVFARTERREPVVAHVVFGDAVECLNPYLPVAIARYAQDVVAE